MKLTILTRDLGYGGAQRQIIVLARELKSRGHDVRIVLLYPMYNLDPDVVGISVPVISLDKSGRWDVFRTLWRLIRLLRFDRPDIVHAYLDTSNTLSIVAKPFIGSKIVWGMRVSGMDAGAYDDWLVRVVKLAERQLGRFADLIVFNSHAGLDALAGAGLPRERSIVIPNGIDARRFRRDDDARRLIRAEFGIGPEERLVGLVARLDPMKDHTTFLNAAAAVARVRPDVRFLCVGPGPDAYAGELHDLASRLGLSERIVWTGARNDMPAIYNALDVLTLTSCFGEGFPNVIGEAMATGVPCVVTDVGDSAWVVGNLGTVVPVRTPETLAPALLEMLHKTDTGQIDRSALRNSVVERFSVESLTATTESALAELLE